MGYKGKQIIRKQNNIWGEFPKLHRLFGCYSCIRGNLSYDSFPVNKIILLSECLFLPLDACQKILIGLGVGLEGAVL